MPWAHMRKIRKIPGWTYEFQGFSVTKTDRCLKMSHLICLQWWSGSQEERKPITGGLHRKVSGADLGLQSSPWALAFISGFSFFVKSCLTQLQLPSQGKSMTFTEVSQHASLTFHFPFLTEVYAHPGSTISPWIFFPLSQKMWSSEKKLQAFAAISTFTSTLNGWTAQLCWVGFYYQLDIP